MSTTRSKKNAKLHSGAVWENPIRQGTNTAIYSNLGGVGSQSEGPERAQNTEYRRQHLLHVVAWEWAQGFR
jgi:hypothetical protein